MFDGDIASVIDSLESFRRSGDAESVPFDVCFFAFDKRSSAVPNGFVQTQQNFASGSLSRTQYDGRAESFIKSETRMEFFINIETVNERESKFQWAYLLDIQAQMQPKTEYYKPPRRTCERECLDRRTLRKHHYGSLQANVELIQ